MHGWTAPSIRLAPNRPDSRQSRTRRHMGERWSWVACGRVERRRRRV